MNSREIRESFIDYFKGKGHKSVRSSSVVPSFFPGRYQNISADSKPYFKNSVLEIPISTFSSFKIPLGLLWMNLFSPYFKRLVKIKSNPIILYLHLFDILPNKKGGDQFNWVVNKWYSIKQKEALNTLTDFVDAGIRNNMRFVRLVDVYRSYQ